MAELADRHVLYQQSVQCVEAEIDFVDETFTELRGRNASSLREDFCGTANTSCEWLRRRKKNTAIGVDLDLEVLAWGQANNIDTMGKKAASRIRLLGEDVLQVNTEPMDMILAMNFSYWLFMDRKTMKQYFRRVHESLAEDGIFFLDAYGGYDSFKVLRERTDYDDFTYTWHQASYNPINGRMQCYIHFKFPDGSRLKRAFSYEWRLWTIPELLELLQEAGFEKPTVYLQGFEEDTGEPDGIFLPTEVGDADAGWIAYIVAAK